MENASDSKKVMSVLHAAVASWEHQDRHPAGQLVGVYPDQVPEQSC